MPDAESDAACLCGLVVTGGCPTHPHGRPDLDSERAPQSWPPCTSGQVYVADAEGVVWLLVPEYDGGIATTSTATGQWSVGINTLTSHRRPLVRVFPPDGKADADADSEKGADRCPRCGLPSMAHPSACPWNLPATHILPPAECDRGPCYLGYDHDGPCKPGRVLPPETTQP